MMSGHYQGRFLSLISKIINPKVILEIGTFTGYATLCLAEGLQADGVVHTIDVNEELQPMQRAYFSQSENGDRIIQHLGQAQHVIPTISENFDLVFIDADKKNYPLYYELVIDKMNRGGVILSDNVLWSGKVLGKDNTKDKRTDILYKYNEMLKNDKRLDTIILPIRDGITLSRVK